MPNAAEFQKLIRMQNTNLNGKQKVPFALRIIKGIGRRFATLVCKIAQIDVNRRAGDLTKEEQDKITAIFADPLRKFVSLFVYSLFCKWRA